ncbi:hypothetical protein Emag_005100 [Eimeria magna]
MAAANAPPAVEAALAPEAPEGPAARCRYAVSELLAARRQAVKQSLPSLADRGGGTGHSAASGHVASGGSQGAHPQDVKGSEQQQQQLVEPEGHAHLRHLADVAAFRVAARPQEPKGAQQPTGRSGPPGFGGLPRTLSGGSKEVASSSPQLEGGAAEVYVLRAVQRAPRLESSLHSSCIHPLLPCVTPITSSHLQGLIIQRLPVNLCGAVTLTQRAHMPCLVAAVAARQRLVSLAQEAGPGGLPLSQVLQRHLCAYNSLLEPHALGFDDLGALVRSAWPAVQLRTHTKQEQLQQQRKLEEGQSAPGQQARPQGQEELTKKASVPAPHGQQQQQQQGEQQLPDEEQKKQQEHPSQERQEAGELNLAESAAAAAACSGEKRQEHPRASGLDEPEASVVVYVRPLLSLEAHLFSNLLFALIADAAEQHQQQQEALGSSACEGPDTPKQLEPFNGVPFAALPRLWQEKYSALADLRHFQVAAGARDLCAFLEGLPEVTLQRKQGALLVGEWREEAFALSCLGSSGCVAASQLSLIEGVAVPEGPQYIPNELRRPALAAGGLRLVGPASAALMPLTGQAPAAALLPGPTLLQQQHRRAVAATPLGAASGLQQQQQQQPSWQPRGWSLDTSAASLAGGQQLCLQAAQTLLKHLQEQQQAAPEQQDRMRGAAAPHQPPAGNSSLDRRAVLQPTSQLQQQQQLQRLLREAVEGLEDGGGGRCHLKSVPLVDATTASRDARQGAVSAALQQAQQQQQQQQQQAAVAGVLAELLATQKLSRADPSTELHRQLAVPQQQQVISANSTGRLQLRRRLLSFVRAACKQQRHQWHHNEDLSEMLMSKQQQQQQSDSVDDINPQLRQQLLLLLQLDSQLQQLLQQQQQQASEQASTTMGTANPATGDEQTRGAAAAAVRRYLLRLLGSPAVAAARSRHRLRTAGMTVSAMKQLWKHQYGESLSQRLEEAGVTFGELVESEPQLFVLGTGRSLRIATRQHLEDFGLLQLAAAAPAQAASPEAAYAGGTLLAAKARVASDEKKPAVLPQGSTDQQRQKQLLLLLLQQMQHLQQQQQQQQQSSAQSFPRLQEPQQQQHQQQSASLQQRDQQEQTLQLLQRFLSGADSRGPAGNRASVVTLSERPQDAVQSPAVTSNSSTLLGSLADYTRSVAPLKTNADVRLSSEVVSAATREASSAADAVRGALAAGAAPSAAAPAARPVEGRARREDTCRKPSQKPASASVTEEQEVCVGVLTAQGIVGVRVSDLAAEWRRLYGCDLEAPMRHAGYANQRKARLLRPLTRATSAQVLSLVSAVPGLFLVGEGQEARCLVALPAAGAGQGQQRNSGPMEEPHAGGKSELRFAEGATTSKVSLLRTSRPRTNENLRTLQAAAPYLRCLLLLLLLLLRRPASGA